MTQFGISRSPQIVLFGPGQRHALPELIKNIGKRVFICTDNRFLVDPLLFKIASDLRDAGCSVEIYDETIAELPMSCIDAATAKAKKFKPEIIVGVGGGSCMDIAKLVSLSLSYIRSLSEYYGEFKVPGEIIPVVAITTTAGTGSEVTPVAVLDDPSRLTKVGISSPYLIPKIAICDPELTLSCPPKLTAIAGADAITHAIEAFTAIRKPYTPQLAMQQVFVGKNIFSDMHSRIAISSLAKNLHKAVNDSKDLDARSEVMLGSMSAGIAFGVAGTAAAHAIQYPIGAMTHTSHGLGVAAILPYVMEFNLPKCVPEFCEIASLFGGQRGDKSDLHFASSAIDYVDALFTSIGIPKTIQELGITIDSLDLIGEQSMSAARLINNNPRLLDRSAVDAIIRAAFIGSREQLRGI